jgi:hypothetical protein
MKTNKIKEEIKTFWVTKLLDVTGKKITPFGFRTCVVKYSDYIKAIQQTQKQATADLIKMIEKVKNKVRTSKFSYPTPSQSELEFYHRLQIIALELLEQELK